MKKYMVYLDDGRDCYKVAVPAANEKAARKYVEGNGEVIAVKDISEDYPISLDTQPLLSRVKRTLPMFLIELRIRLTERKSYFGSLIRIKPLLMNPLLMKWLLPFIDGLQIIVAPVIGCITVWVILRQRLLQS